MSKRAQLISEQRDRDTIGDEVADLLRFKTRAHIAYVAGITLTGLGAVSLALALVITAIDLTQLDRLAILGVLGGLGLIVGVVLVSTAALALHGRSIDEAYLLGYDRGLERGFAEARPIEEHDDDQEPLWPEGDIR